jgi:chromosome segregation ATPase
MSAPQFTRAQQQEEELFQRRKTIFEKIHKIRTRFYHLDKEMAPLNIEVQVAHIKLQADRARVQYFTTKIPELTQELMEGNFESEYAIALSAYENYKRNKPDDKEGIRREYTSLLKIHAKLKAQIREILAPLQAEAAQAMENVTKYKSIHDSAYDRLQDLELEKYDLVQELQALVAEDTALNQPPPPPPPGRGRRHRKGTKRRRSTHNKGNKGKKRRHSTHKRKKRH